jgi:hypothetical protein
MSSVDGKASLGAVSVLTDIRGKTVLLPSSYFSGHVSRRSGEAEHFSCLRSERQVPAVSKVKQLDSSIFIKPNIRRLQIAKEDCNKFDE